MHPPLEFSTIEARRLHRRLVWLDPEPEQALEEVLAHLGYVQLDPLNVCGRMHDLILRNRVRGYRAGDLLSWLHGAGEDCRRPSDRRGGFEHFLPRAGVLVAYPWEAWPHVQVFMRERRKSVRGYHGRLSREEEAIAARIVAELGERGALTSDDIAHDGSGVTAWGSRAKTTKIVLEKLFAHGRVLIARRRGFRRVYDLPERVVPREIALGPESTQEEAERWHVLLRLRQRRLVRLRQSEAALLGDRVRRVRVEGALSLFCLSEDVSRYQLQKDAMLREWNSRETLLVAPLDPLIYDRALTRTLWGFDYTWEVYTPAAKRQRGYYALPVLSGDVFVGHVEPRYNARTGKMSVLSRRVRRGHPTAGAVKSLAHCLAAECVGRKTTA